MKAQHIVLFVIAGIIGFVIAFYVSFTGMDSGWLMPISLAIGVGIPLFLLIRLLFINKPVHRAGKGEEATARSGAPPAGAAALFVYRDQFVGRLVGTDLTVDDKPVGQLRGKTFYRFDLPAGEHAVKSSMAGKATGGLTVTLKVGERVYVREAFEMGMIKNTLTLSIAAATEGAKAVGKCRLLQTAALAALA